MTFFLTDIDVPWEKRRFKDKAEGRDAVFALKINNHKPFITLSGDKNLRLEKAIAIVDLSKAKELGLSRSILSKFTTMEFHLKMFVGN
jgi:hypothetical protein